MTNDEFFQFRCSHEVTSAEIAHHIGSSVRHMLRVETGHEQVKQYMVDAVLEIAKARGQ